MSACNVWNNCTKAQSDRLEQLQLEAARIVTSSVKGTQHKHLRLCHTGAKNRQRKIVTKFLIRCVCHTEGLKSWQIMKKMTHKNLKIVKKT